MANKVGRPDGYSELVAHRLDEIKDWVGKGYTRPEVASLLGIDRSTLHVYMNKHPELKEAIKTGDREIVANVEGALAKKAIEGNVLAMIFLLKNKAPDQWRDRQIRDVNITGPDMGAIERGKERALRKRQ